MTEATDLQRERLAALARLSEARTANPEADRKAYRHEDFLYDAQQNAFWFRAGAVLLEAGAVNSLIPTEVWRVPMREADARGRAPQPIPPARDIARIERGLMVEGSTWLPGRPEIAADIFATRDGFMPMRGVRAFNTYRPGPKIDLSRAGEAGPWIEHVRKLYPDEAEYFFDVLAHMVQRPEEKANIITVLSGAQGIGKDTVLHPVRHAVGEWNCRNIGPDDLLDPNNEWAACVMLTIDEVRPMESDHRATAIYDKLKALSVAPPYTIGVKEKYEKRRYVANVMRIFATTNDRLALYLPPEDRRAYVMHSLLPPEWHVRQQESDPDYFVRLFNFIENGGQAAVAAFLSTRDISRYNPKAPPPKTDTWQQITQRWDNTEEELDQALEMLGRPEVVFGAELAEQLFDGAEELRKMMKSRGFIFKMEQAGYSLIPLPAGQRHWRKRSGEWRFQSRAAYVRKDLGWDRQRILIGAAERLDARAAAGPTGKVEKPKVVQLRVGEGF